MSAVEISPARARIGEAVRISLTVTNTDRVRASPNVDLRIHFIKVKAGASPKVFKVRGLELGPGKSRQLSKVVSLPQHTTGTHYPGERRVEVVLNGVAGPLGSFVVDG